MSDSKIVWDADNGRVDNKMRKTRGEADQVGKAINRWGGEIVGAALKLGSVVRVISEISSEIDKSQSKAANANRSSGAGVLERGRALRDLGLSQGADESLRNLSGGATLDERSAFLTQLAAAQRSAKRPFDQQQIMRALNLQAEGVTGGDEIIKALQGGRLDELIATNAQRRGQLSDAERSELTARDFERQAQLRVEAASSGDRGRQLRLGQAAIEARNAENPTIAGAQGVIGGLLSPIGGDSFIKSGDLAVFVDMNKNLAAIAATNKQMANGQPNLNTSPDGVP